MGKKQRNGEEETRNARGKYNTIEKRKKKKKKKIEKQREDKNRGK